VLICVCRSVHTRRTVRPGPLFECINVWEGCGPPPPPVDPTARPGGIVKLVSESGGGSGGPGPKYAVVCMMQTRHSVPVGHYSGC
jgi:hypothetical protein